TPYSYFRYQSHLAALNAVDVFAENAAAFAQAFGRTYQAVEAYHCDDAELVFVMMGSFATKAKEAVDRLREAGEAVGLLRPVLLRPFPAADFRRALSGKKGVIVVDQNLSMGKGGVLHTELASALYGYPETTPVLVSFIGGLGGRDISAEEFYEMHAVTRQAVSEKRAPAPRLLYTEVELREMKKIQAIARVQGLKEQQT
ncbi:MAG: pyruvate synthase, partial [Deltaproteobacteria bacterium]|nr:pyruvate synthase [Deltaproteobacteria bacterium]